MGADFILDSLNWVSQILLYFEEDTWNQNVLNQDISIIKLWSSRGSIHILAEKKYF